jgi:hypothetical protein
MTNRMTARFPGNRPAAFLRGIASHAPTLAVLVAALAVLAGCTATPGIDSSKPVDPREVMRLVEQRNRQVLALKGSGKISVESPEFSGGGTIRISTLKPDSLQLEINGPFGVTVARGMVTGQSFQFYNGYDNTISEGATTPQNLRRVLRFPIAFSDVQDILTGTLGFGAAPRDAAPTAVMKDDGYVLQWTAEGHTLEYTVDLATFAIRRFVRRGADGEILEEILFRDFRRKGDLEMPQIVSVTRPVDEENLTIAYDRMTINDLPMEFTFTYPKSARRISF